jgi:hypothetical protein
MDLFERLRNRFRGLGFTADVIKVNQDDKTSFAFRGHKFQIKLAEITLKFFEEAERITGDQRLTNVGQNEKIRNLGEQTLAEIEKEKLRFLGPIETELNRLEALIAPPGPSEEQQSVVSTLREIEPRSFLLNMPEADRMSLLFRAAELGDEHIYNAAIHAPASFELFTDEIIEKAKRLWGLQQRPEETKAYENIKEVYDTLMLNLQECNIEIRARAGLPNADEREILDLIESMGKD